MTAWIIVAIIVIVVCFFIFALMKLSSNLSRIEETTESSWGGSNGTK